jgi:hypothetical protein
MCRVEQWTIDLPYDSSILNLKSSASLDSIHIAVCVVNIPGGWFYHIWTSALEIELGSSSAGETAKTSVVSESSHESSDSSATSGDTPWLPQLWLDSETGLLIGAAGAARVVTTVDCRELIVADVAAGV